MIWQQVCIVFYYFIYIIISKILILQLILYVENRKLKNELAELRSRFSQLERTNADLSRENSKLKNENHFLAGINEAFANENDDLRESVERFSKYRLPKSLRQQDDGNRPSKRPKTTKSKGKKAVRVSDDELEYDSNSEEQRTESEEKDVKGARVCLNYIIFFF